MKKPMVGVLVATIVFLGLALVCTFGAVSALTPPEDTAIEQVDTPLPTATPKKSPSPSNVRTAGTYQVGVDIKPGTYVTTVPEDEMLCYWARLKGFDGELGSIIVNDNLMTGAKGRMVVKKTDKGVQFTGNCKWSLLSNP